MLNDKLLKNDGEPPPLSSTL